ncbi:DUF2507 domain-containing protein [Agrilactobacillus fermenti]|uniref:DUF2507 domain-containing protein n=1 Tax=Agrilactobacillus fermenti TaxID=2586909 RepID=UPI003A5BB5CB
MLTTNTKEISYWAGKQLARKVALPDIETIQNYFVMFGFGALTLTKQKQNQYYFDLQGDPVIERLAMNDAADFHLETGFLAQQLQQELGVIVEGICEVDHKHSLVHITIQSDPKDPADFDTTQDQSEKMVD